MAFSKSYAQFKVDKRRRMAIFPELKKIGKSKISAGIFKNEGSETVSESGAKLIDVAVQNNYGNEWSMPKTVRFQKNGKWFHIKRGTPIKIPATRFITRIIENQSEREYLLANAEAAIHMVLKGYLKGNQGIKDIGNYMVNSIKRYIDTKQFQPNTPLTIEAKGFDKRLFDKGRLYNALKWRSSSRGLN